jgi:hypothetical protein
MLKSVESMSNDSNSEVFATNAGASPGRSTPPTPTGGLQSEPPTRDVYTPESLGEGGEGPEGSGATKATLPNFSTTSQHSHTAHSTHSTHPSLNNNQSNNSPHNSGGAKGGKGEGQSGGGSGKCANEQQMISQNKSYIRHRFEDVDESGNLLCKFQVQIYWAKQFHAVRNCFFADSSPLDFIRSLSGANKWNAQGGKVCVCVCMCVCVCVCVCRSCTFTRCCAMSCCAMSCCAMSCCAMSCCVRPIIRA